MLNISPQGLPTKRPHTRSFARTHYAHMAASMLVLGLAAGIALNRIIASRERSHGLADEMKRKAMESLHRRAEDGDTIAQLELANAYAYGIGLTANTAAAARWNKAAAENGNPSAQFRLARALSEGEGVERNFAAAVALLRKSAEQGSVEARLTLGIYLFRGIGTEKNLVEGHHWLALAANAGSTSAQLALDAVRKQMTPEQIAETEKQTPAP